MSTATFMILIKRYLALLFVGDAGGPQWFGISIHCQYEYFWLCLLVRKSRHLCVRGDNKKRRYQICVTV